MQNEIPKPILERFSNRSRALKCYGELAELLAESPFSGLAESVLGRVAECPGPDRTLTALLRILRAAKDFQGDLSFLEACPQDPWRILLVIASQSAYFTDLCSSRPSVLHWLMTEENVDHYKTAELLTEELQKETEGIEEETPWLNRLRRFRRRELLRVGVRDILNCTNIENICREISAVADVLISMCTDRAIHETNAQYGRQETKSENGQPPFAVIAMGKLGGSELNWSSDVDLLFVYGDEKETGRGPEETAGDTAEYFSRIASRLVRYLTEPSEEGYLFRADMRLRPQGKAGPLALSLSAYEFHYETLGQPWERQALLKARPVAGDPALGKAFVDIVRPFTYRRTVDSLSIDETLDGIHRMRLRYEPNGEQAGRSHRDVKFGRGGIREVEFIVQAVQILYGGQYPEIREPSTFTAIRRIRDSGLFSQKDFEVLYGGYSLMRRVEHRIQMEREFHTFTLPAKDRDLERLARKLGYPGAREFLADYEAEAEAIASIYDEIFPGRGDEQDMFDSLLQPPEPGDPGENYLAERGFVDASSARRRIYDLSWDPQNPHLCSKTQRLFRSILPRLLGRAAQSPDPDRAVRNLERILRGYGGRSGFFTALADRETAIDLFVTLGACSQHLTNLMARKPSLVDFLMRPPVNPGSVRVSDMRKDLFDRCNASPGVPLLEHLRFVKNVWELQMGAQFLLRQCSIEAITAGLTRLAEFVLFEVIEAVRDELTTRFVRPSRATGKPVEFAVLGLGKLGGREMNFNSDLDLIFVYSDPGPKAREDPELPAPEFFLRWAQGILKELNESTGAGSLYEADARLRPHGRNAPLILPYSAFENYYEKEAAVWERQAWIRARPVWAEGKFRRRLEQLAERFCYQKKLTQSDWDEIARIRRRVSTERKGGRLKIGPGGIVDIEFLVQALLLRHVGDTPGIRSGNTFRALHGLREHAVLDTDEGRLLEDTYMLFREIENFLQIMERVSAEQLPEDAAALESLVKRLHHLSGQQSPDPMEWVDQFTKRRQQMIKIVDRYLSK